MAMDAGPAFNAAWAILVDSGFEITGQQAPQAIQFAIIKKDLWNTGGMKVRYTGEVRFSQSQPRQTQARISLKVDWGNSMGIVAMCVVCAAMFFAILPLIMAGYTIYTVSSVWPKKISDELQARLQSAAGAAPAHGYSAPPQQQAAAPPPPPVTPPVTPAAPAAEAALTPHEQLRKLKELFDIGALTDAEFDAKKTEILARL